MIRIALDQCMFEALENRPFAPFFEYLLGFLVLRTVIFGYREQAFSGIIL